ncbi:DUF3466 family protein [Vibrio coralliilyticus]|uniref:DUF3466 family protein n=1 Tax=Vibrio coralliilyticus TaxID=190893 RepID=UPI00148B903C|nr:DUF3466 family protein [Vibrio coralliilyticus]NOH54205.1 DUF3466 family protein [Vibrio coralliilyticus]
MSSKIFKLSSITLAVAASFGAHAAIYNVVEVTPSISANEFYGRAIQDSPSSNNGTNPLGCFDSSYPAVASCSTDYVLAGESRKWAEGISYREEAPFAMDNSFTYVSDQSDFENYCYAQLRYATCNTWAETEWTGYANEISGSDDYSNSALFIEGGSVVEDANAVVNSLFGTTAIGNKRSSSRRNEAFGSGTIDIPSTGDVVQTHVWVTDGTYTVGSVSRRATNGNDGHFDFYYSRPAIWSNSGGDPAELKFGRTDDITADGDTLSQGSIRDFKVDGTNFYGVGYNTYDDQRMDATIFTGTTSSLGDVGSKQVSGTESGSDYIYSNSVVSSINDNFVAVGSAKRAGDKPQNRAASNRLFYVSDVKSSSPAATYFSGGIFFDGAGGTMGSINNFNEVVGSVDISSAAEVDGTERAKRAFINPLDATNTNATRRSSIFDSKAWILDDLTNDGSASSTNNRYRIIDASDINDAGVISATAIKCENGYDTTEVDSYCQGGAVNVEKVVAVKLVPIAGNGKDNIQSRGYRTETVDRQGGSLGFLALTLLGFLGFRRK